MKNSIKNILSFSVLFFVALNAFALEVDQDEIYSLDTDSIEFENYTGPHDIIESAAAITGIGTSLGMELAENIQEARTIQEGAKYYVIHATDTENDGLLSADIFILSEQAGVDHIVNLRRILTGFLSGAYNYSIEDAQTLATFITVYNAVYKDSFEQISGKYKEIVKENIDVQKAGLSKNWEDWAGNTQIIIPLKDVTEDTLPVDTTTISDDNVIEAMRQEEGMGIEDREQMLDIKEREAETASKNAQDAQKEAAKQRQEGNKEAAAQSAQKSSQQQQIADRKQTEIQTERKNIEKDKTELASTPKIEYTTGLFGADKKGFFQLINLNGSTGEIIRKSNANQIRSKAVFEVQGASLFQDGTLLTYPKMFIAISGEKSGKSGIRLSLIDSETLELKAESAEILAETSDLVPYGDRFFVIIVQDKKNYIAAYDKNLTLKNKSQITVNASTPFNLTDKGLLVTDSNGNPCLLNYADLTTIWQATNSKNEK